ncbi:unnamed protein product [Phytophthora fragariaefolia]|uniref:Unnamed protein product n=1 Tax=Phytophthora fragariaefolia TaxID=1490495 RepID=A0A9W6XAU1_9STRA|nr:unnamed protein product [Phytophthora fragariaefolia]
MRTIFPYCNQVFFRQPQHINCERSLRQVHKTGSEDGFGWVMDASLVQTAHSRICGLASMRSSRGEKSAAPAAAPHDIDFGHLWRQLRVAGWTSKRPTGIQTEWTYKGPDGEKGLVGERAVVEYAFESGLLVEDEEHAGEEDGGGEHVEDEGGGGEHIGEESGGGGGDNAAIRPSEIDISAAVARAFNLSQRDLQADNEQRVAAASLHLLSDVSGLESEEEDGRAVTSPIASPWRTRIPVKLDVDVNVLQNGESSSEYEDFSSDESDSAGICDDDGDSGSDEFDEEGAMKSLTATPPRWTRLLWRLCILAATVN